MPARFKAFPHARVLAQPNGIPAYVNTFFGCLPSCRRNTAKAAVFSGQAFPLIPDVTERTLLFCHQAPDRPD